MSPALARAARPAPRPADRRILYLALADGRGHLMRAHLLAGLLGDAGVAVDVVTTSRAGQGFLAALGTPAAVLPAGFALPFDAGHNMDRGATRAGVVRYLVGRRRYRADLDALTDLAAGADLVVNDSFHPALLWSSLGRPLVHVYGDTMRGAFEDHLGGAPAWLDALYRRALARVLDGAFGHVVHTHGPAAALDQRNRVRLPPIVPMPGRSPRAVRRALGVGAGQRLAVVYLNPHFRDPRIAAAVEGVLAAHGLFGHLVGEGYAGRAGWRPVDPALADAIATADLFVSGAGMAALAMARAFAAPMVTLVADQPEQQANARSLDPRDAIRAVALAQDRPLGPALADAVAAVTAATHTHPRVDARAEVARIHRSWTQALFELVDRAHPATPNPTRTRP